MNFQKLGSEGNRRKHTADWGLGKAQGQLAMAGNVGCQPWRGSGKAGRGKGFWAGATLNSVAGILLLQLLRGPALGQAVSPLTESARANAEQQIRLLMEDKARRSPVEQKLDSQLLFAARRQTGGLIYSGAPKLREALVRESDGRIKVELKAAATPELLEAIQAAGGAVLGSWPEERSILALVPLGNIAGLAARSEVSSIRPAPKATFSKVDSEGDATHQAVQARAGFNAAGARIKVGVLSDSIDNGSNALAAAVAGGDIDGTNTFVLTGQAGTGEAEGLAMCEIVHDLAPRASLYFATAEPSEAQMAANILGLAQAGCRVIIDDVSYSDESPFQDGPVARAVSTVCSNGVLYFSCARNSGNLNGGTSCTWEGDFVDGGSAGTFGRFHQFAGGQNANPIGNGGYAFEANLFWSDPLGASTNDYDLYMIDALGDIMYASDRLQTGTQDPYEHLSDAAQLSYGYYLVVTRYSGTGRYLHLDFGRGRLGYATGGCIRGHNACDAPNSFTVAATPAAAAFGAGEPAGPYPSPFNSGNVVEPFSSDGPRRMFYTAGGGALTPGNFSSSGGRVFYKPELTAADGVTTTPPGFAPFFGTSAAAPHAGAIAAMVLSYNPGLSPAQVRSVLTNSCIGIMSPGWDRDSGCGILMALAALQNTPPPNPPCFVLNSMRYSTNGQFQAALAGTPGLDYWILVSTNLQTWNPLMTLSMTNTNSTFADPTAGRLRRFYRAQLAP